MTNSSEIWRTDPFTLREVILDARGARERLPVCPLPERLLLLALLGQQEQALEEGFTLLQDRSGDRFDVLLVLAKILQREHRWHEAAQLQEQALRLATTRTREATTRHHIDLRLFDEALYRDAAAEFQWASNLHRVSGHNEHAEASLHAMQRALQLQGAHLNYFRL
jgi:tetratricopeptide (TPR) repeat protein